MKINRFLFILIVTITLGYAVFINAIYDYKYPILLFIFGWTASWGVFIKDLGLKIACVIVSFGCYLLPIKEFYSLTVILFNGANDFKGVFTNWIFLTVIFALTYYTLRKELISK